MGFVPQRPARIDRLPCLGWLRWSALLGSRSRTCSPASSPRCSVTSSTGIVQSNCSISSRSSCRRYSPSRLDFPWSLLFDQRKDSPPWRAMQDPLAVRVVALQKVAFPQNSIQPARQHTHPYEHVLNRPRLSFLGLSVIDAQLGRPALATPGRQLASNSSTFPVVRHRKPVLMVLVLQEVGQSQGCPPGRWSVCLSSQRYPFGPEYYHPSEPAFPVATLFPAAPPA